MTTATRGQVPGAFALVLNSHLPWVCGHGVRPHGEEWLFQAVAESYVPLVDELDVLAEEGHRDVLTLGVTPVLAAQLDDERLMADARTWAGRWEQRAREIGASGAAHERDIAAYEAGLARRAQELLATRWRGGGSPVFRSLQDRGVVELLGGPLAHPFLPLLVPEVASFTLRCGLMDSILRYGARPRGIWSPECAWAPWLGDVVDAAGVGHLVVDEQVVLDAGGHPHGAWRVAGRRVLAVPRDAEVTNLISSSRTGYPTGRVYRDVHDRETGGPSGLRMWAVASPEVSVEAAAGYEPVAAAAQVAVDVAHFVDAVVARLTGVAAATGIPGLVVAAYDTELFGHGWHEGPRFLGAAIRALRTAGVTVTTLSGAIDAGYVAGELDLGEGSWGPGRDFSAWRGSAVTEMSREGWWVQRRFVDIVHRERARGSLLARRPDLDQLARTMVAMLSSDWAFLATVDQAADYARTREGEHRRDFHRLAQLIEDGRSFDALAEASRLREVDHAFPKLDARRLDG